MHSTREVLSLYCNGKGYWSCKYPDNSLHEVPLCFDFFTIARCITDDLTAVMKKEMMDFTSKDLWDGNWMRALALYDHSAQKTLSTEKGRDSVFTWWQGTSLRTDHGCTGAFDAWPALTAESYIWFGKPQLAYEYLKTTDAVLDEGTFGQAHYVSDEIRPARKTALSLIDYYNSAGVTFAEVVVRSFFGFDPDNKWGMIRLPKVNRGFEAKLMNVNYTGKNYEITCSENGINSREIK